MVHQPFLRVPCLKTTFAVTFLIVEPYFSACINILKTAGKLAAPKYHFLGKFRPQCYALMLMVSTFALTSFEPSLGFERYALGGCYEYFNECSIKAVLAWNLLFNFACLHNLLSLSITQNGDHDPSFCGNSLRNIKRFVEIMLCDFLLCWRVQQELGLISLVG